MIIFHNWSVVDYRVDVVIVVGVDVRQWINVEVLIGIHVGAWVGVGCLFEV